MSGSHLLSADPREGVAVAGTEPRPQLTLNAWRLSCCPLCSGRRALLLSRCGVTPESRPVWELASEVSCLALSRLLTLRFWPHHHYSRVAASVRAPAAVFSAAPPSMPRF